jgi:hypothetical protein
MNIVIITNETIVHDGRTIEITRVRIGTYVVYSGPVARLLSRSDIRRLAGTRPGSSASRRSA